VLNLDARYRCPELDRAFIAVAPHHSSVRADAIGIEGQMLAHAWQLCSTEPCAGPRYVNEDGGMLATNGRQVSD
jgi:hypothetical protein